MVVTYVGRRDAAETIDVVSEKLDDVTPGPVQRFVV